MFNIKQISKLQTVIFLTLFAVGFVPLAGFVTMNLSSVVKKMNVVEDEKQVEKMLQQFNLTRQVIERRKESIRVLSRIPGVRDLVDNKNGLISSPVVLKRMTNMLTDWFKEEKDVLAISFVDSEGREQLRLKRSGNELFSSSPQIDLTDAETDAFLECTHEKPGEFYIGDIVNRVIHIGNKHVHELILYVGVPIAAKKTKGIGALLLELDLKYLLPKTGIKYLLINGHGNYYVNPVHNAGHDQKEHEHINHTAFADFKGLKSALRKKSNFVVFDRQGIKYIWAALLIGYDRKHTLWAGQQIDQAKIQQWTYSFLGKFVLIFILFTFFIVLVAGWLALTGDKLKKELTIGLEGLLNKNMPLELNWHWPRELDELCHDLTSLSSRYLEISGHREQVEQELKDVNDRLEMILNSVAEGILGLDHEGEIIFANQAAVKMFGFSDVEELIGNDLHSLLHFMREDKSQYPTDECPFCRALESNKVDVEAEDVFWKKDKSCISVEYLASPIYDDNGEIVGTVMCIRDISERKSAEEKMASLQNQLLHAQKMEAIGTLAGGVAHDFNNLLTHITGYSDIMLMEISEDDPLRKYVDIIQNAARRAGGLTRQLLTFSRKQSMRAEVLDLNILVKNIDKMLRRFIGENIVLANQLTRQPAMVKADSGMIEQILMNLVINARDAMPNGGRINISTQLVTVTEEDIKYLTEGWVGDFVCLRVTDNGSGIAEEEIERIFDPFFTTKGIGKGTGLGLSVVYGIIKQHKGWITVSSKLNKGTVFSIYFPDCRGEKNVKEKNDQKNISMGHGERILLVEDEKNVIDVAEKILNMNGYQPYCAETVQGALDIFAAENGQFDLVFSDIVLPDGTGLHLIEQILAKNLKIRVLMTSGYADDRAQLTIIKRRNIPFLQKPYTRLDLLNRIHDLLA